MRSKRSQSTPVVLSKQEIHNLLSEMSGVHGLMAGLMYGTGMRLMECIRLRVKDIEFSYLHITVRDGKGKKGRFMLLQNRHTPRPCG